MADVSKLTTPGPTRGLPQIVRTDSHHIRILKHTDPEAVPMEVDDYTPSNWQDYEQQYRVLFDPQHPDLEAQLMGVPPPPWWADGKRRLSPPKPPPGALGPAWRASCHQSGPSSCPSSAREV